MPLLPLLRHCLHHHHRHRLEGVLVRVVVALHLLFLEVVCQGFVFQGC